ncbi:MAG: hypothetical protein KME13_13100 [Myxacorys californica WJT36-NPBG1]|jgi:hypothetical protein|nr:hypothetical protein [Myxacorys californica WJT36-NPBG1]
MFYTSEGVTITRSTLRRTEEILIKGATLAEIWRSTVVQSSDGMEHVARDSEPLLVTPDDVVLLAEQWENLPQYHAIFGTKEALIASLTVAMPTLMFIGDAADKRRMQSNAES